MSSSPILTHLYEIKGEDAVKIRPWPVYNSYKALITTEYVYRCWSASSTTPIHDVRVEPGFQQNFLLLFFSVGKLIDAVAWTHWGCCVCTGDRCAVAAARGQHNLYGTHEDMAAPADTETTAKTQDTPTVCIKSLLYNMKSKSVSAGVLANLVIVKRLQTDCTVIRLYRLGRVTPQFGLTIHFGLQGRHSLQNILFRKQLKNRAQQNMLFTWLQLSFFMSACGHIS